MEACSIGSFMILYITTLDDLVLEPIMPGQVFSTRSLVGIGCYVIHIFFFFFFSIYGAGSFHSSAKENSENF